MCRRALHKNMRISLNPEYHQRKAAKMRQLQVYDTTRRPELPTVVPALPSPPIVHRQSKPQQPNNQIVVENNVLVMFS